MHACSIYEEVYVCMCVCVRLRVCKWLAKLGTFARRSWLGLRMGMADDDRSSCGRIEVELM